jgi:hypothetical protein
MMLKPCCRLANGVFVKILDVKTVGNDANTDVPVGKTPERGRRTWHRTELSKQVSLCHGEPMDVFILLLGRNAPLAKAVRRIGHERFLGHTKPLGNYGTKSIVEICHDAI